MWIISEGNVVVNTYNVTFFFIFFYNKQIRDLSEFTFYIRLEILLRSACIKLAAITYNEQDRKQGHP